MTGCDCETHHLSIGLADSRTAGSCNFCGRFDYDRVAVVRGRGPLALEVRFCRVCAKDIGLRWPR